MVKCYTSVLDLSDTFPELSCQICQAHHKQQSHLSCAELALVSIPPNVEFIDFYSLLIYFVLFILNYHLRLFTIFDLASIGFETSQIFF